jgi:hypothetical protein
VSNNSATAAVINPQAVGVGGWRTPIPTITSGDFTKPLGYANTPIVGLAIGPLVTNPVITIRPDGNSCASCHGGDATMRPQWDARTLTRTQFCNMVPSFLAANKPAVVKAVFGAWKDAGCPN